MPVSDRAKQFMPFAALSGLSAALEAKEREIVARRELSEDAAAELDITLRHMQRGCKVCVTYYRNGQYQKITGVLRALDPAHGMICVDDVRIAFCDLFCVEETDI